MLRLCRQALTLPVQGRQGGRGRLIEEQKDSSPNEEEKEGKKSYPGNF
jgi:hypothetical protein